jgi:hypothetical protein
LEALKASLICGRAGKNRLLEKYKGNSYRIKLSGNKRLLFLFVNDIMLFFYEIKKV